jgi:hypothetical protein
MEKPAPELRTEAGASPRQVRPYLEYPVVAGAGGGGGGVSFFAQAETPSAAAAKATKVKYFAMYISVASFPSWQHHRIRLNTRWKQMDFQFLFEPEGKSGPGFD